MLTLNRTPSLNSAQINSVNKSTHTTQLNSRRSLKTLSLTHARTQTLNNPTQQSTQLNSRDQRNPTHSPTQHTHALNGLSLPRALTQPAHATLNPTQPTHSTQLNALTHTTLSRTQPNSNQHAHSPDELSSTQLTHPLNSSPLAHSKHGSTEIRQPTRHN